MIKRYVLTELCALLLACGTSVFAQQVSTPASVLSVLQKGNDRYASGNSIHPRIDPERRQETARMGQKPIATILGCADSRVPPEIVFDQGFADLFVVRVAGNVVGIPELASIEYAVQYLGTPLVVVLGHSQCGAVQGALAGKTLAGSVPKLIDMIKPAIDQARQEKDSAHTPLLELAIRDNVWHSIEELFKRSPIIAGKVRTGELKVVAAVRALDTGKVTWLGEHPKQATLVSSSK